MTELSEEEVYNLYWQQNKGKKRIITVANTLKVHPADLVIFCRKNGIPLTHHDKSLYPEYCDKRSQHFIRMNDTKRVQQREKYYQKIINAIIKDRKERPRLTPEEAKENIIKLNKLIKEYSEKLDKEDNVT